MSASDFEDDRTYEEVLQDVLGPAAANLTEEQLAALVELIDHAGSVEEALEMLESLPDERQAA